MEYVYVLWLCTSTSGDSYKINFRRHYKKVQSNTVHYSKKLKITYLPIITRMDLNDEIFILKRRLNYGFMQQHREVLEM